MFYNNFTQQEYKSYHVIIPATQQTGALILGDLNAATDLQVIKQYNIKTIITAASGLQHLKIPSQLTHVVFPLMDTKQQNISMYFQLSYRTIQQNLKRGSVLVHCGAGISRSASLVIAYYMKKYNSTFKNAIGHVKKIKPNVCPNLGFELQLKNYQNIINSKKQQPKSIKPKNNNAVQKLGLNSSPYLFEMPLQKPNHSSHRTNSKVMNRVFNKTHAQKIQQRPQKNQSQLFIQGKNANRYNDIESNLSLYQPQKYSRKHALNNRNAISTAKKIKQDSFDLPYKF